MGICLAWYKQDKYPPWLITHILHLTANLGFYQQKEEVKRNMEKKIMVKEIKAPLGNISCLVGKVLHYTVLTHHRTEC